ncbi:hypothetical protein ASPZODRAFT_74026 [Penicilliopsis zonata CBS 506.65]|uniref:Uncharacterized protein n=1 Tax=Penicilliopsis zonata CBS 506.65 TaxID=1073090 RepID=A0A1L9S8V8_9EURO|nr:hypothetical protein ASPZODRAFT_74026 [Penicilliopsis zonata CBS 506.65]OJJ43597.1 hypothetical protein ASPZODRAFT_74026 [Penicilliopsis zonata CBS 506.65]
MVNKLLAIPLLAGLAAGWKNDGPANANHLFNAVHAVMRHPELAQFPNGVSFFLASVPQGTRFYHGTGHPEPIPGLQWVAFEPEHALNFARMARGGPPGGAAGGKEGAGTQQPLIDGGDNGGEERYGYLHTYVTAKELRLLYIDGMSAGPGGSPQSQDRILFNDTINNDFRGGPRVEGSLGGPAPDQQRARLGCQMASETWGGRIDGILRTEGDFEIIMCDFENSLDIVRVVQTKPRQRTRSLEESGSKFGKRGFTARYDDLRGHQAVIDFEHMVSAFSYDIDLFPNNATRPMLKDVPRASLDPIKRDLDAMILSESPARDVFNWQAVTDNIIDRYAARLRTYADGTSFESKDALYENLEAFFAPFLDYASFPDDPAAVIASCQAQLIAPTAPVDGAVAQAVRHVLFRVCSTFTDVLVQDLELDAALDRFEELVAYLGWTELTDSN